MKARVQVNKSLSDKQLLLGQTVEEKVKDKLVDIAQFAVTRTPVWSGAAVTSYSMKHSYSSGRGRISQKERTPDEAGKRQEGLSQLMSDIEGLKPLKNPLVVLSNGAPHFKEWVEPKYDIFGQVKDKFR